MVAAMAFLCRKQPHLHLIWSDPIFSRVGCCSRALQRNGYSVLSLNNQNIGYFQEIRIWSGKIAFCSTLTNRPIFWELGNVSVKYILEFETLYYNYTLPVCIRCILCSRILLWYIRKRIGSTQDLDLSCKSHLMVTTISLPVCQRFSDILQKWGRSLFTKEEENFAVGNVTGKLVENTKDWETCASKNFFGAMHLSPKSWTIGDHSYYYDYYLGGRKWLLHYSTKLGKM